MQATRFGPSRKWKQCKKILGIFPAGKKLPSHPNHYWGVISLNQHQTIQEWENGCQLIDKAHVVSDGFSVHHNIVREKFIPVCGSSEKEKGSKIEGGHYKHSYHYPAHEHMDT